MNAMRVIPKYNCPKCDSLQYFAHLHDTAYNIPETHMAGTERFVCEQCYHTVHVDDVPSGSFPFYLDKRKTPTE